MAKIKTFEDEEWTRKYHDLSSKKYFGGKVIINLKNEKKL